MQLPCESFLVFKGQFEECVPAHAIHVGVT